MSEASKEPVRRYFEEYHNGRDSSVLEGLVVAELLEPTRRAREMVEGAFPDYRIEIEEQVAEGQLVATVWRGYGTHQGEWASPAGAVSATGRDVSWEATTTLRVVDGKIAEVVGSHWDHLGLLQQLGAVETLSPRTGA